MGFPLAQKMSEVTPMSEATVEIGAAFGLSKKEKRISMTEESQMIFSVGVK